MTSNNLVYIIIGIILMNMPVLILLSFIDHITLTLYGGITFNHSRLFCKIISNMFKLY